MKISSPFAPLARLKRNPHLEEINSLLDFLPQAALLVDRSTRQVILANFKAAELSSFTRNELSRMHLNQLFENLDWQDIQSEDAQKGDSISLTLVRRNNPNLEVHAHIRELSGNNPWLLVSLEPLSNIQQRQAERHNQEILLENIRNLSNATQKEDLLSGLESLLEIGQKLLGAPILAVYQAEGKQLELKRCAYIGSPLPERLPSQDLIHLHAPQVWAPGKRTHASIHSFARAESLTYLASVPIGDPNAIIGLLVAADNEAPPGELMLATLQILASEAGSVFQHFYQYHNLQEELERTQRFRRFAEIVQGAIEDTLIVLSKDLKVVRLNQAAETALGYSDGEASNLPIQDILIGKDNIQPALNMALEGVPTLNLEILRLYRRSGEAFQARVNILPVKDKDLVEGVIILVRDLSDQEIAKSHAEQLEQHALLGTVTAIFAHEVRNPINNISTGLQLMAYNLQPGDPQLELITKLQQDCDRLEELMKSVLSFARATEYEMEPVDLGLLVSRLIDRLRPKIAAAGIDHRINASPETPLVMGNPRALEQVFTNLINNAIQAMEKAGGILAIKVQPSETTGKRQHALVIVADNGPGIPKENQDKIFTPFFTTKSSGTGLGLAITKRIVTAHKGIILLNSFPGGTVFTVQIPAIEEPQDEI